MTATILHFESQEALVAYATGRTIQGLLPVPVQGGTVRPHVQAFADAVAAEFPDITTFGTYPTHSPSIDLALDIFPRGKDEGDRLSAWAIEPERYEYFGIDYVIWWQRIYNVEIADYWRDMEDRGGVTANHKDHNHYSFEPTAPARPGTTTEEDDLKEDERNAVIFCAQYLEEVKQGKARIPQLEPIAKAVGEIKLMVGTMLRVVGRFFAWFDKTPAASAEDGAEKLAERLDSHLG